MTKTVTFEKIVGGGKALGYLDGKPCFAAGPLPGETAEVEIIKDKAGFVEAAVVSIKVAHQARRLEAEPHYMACSPWQNIEYDYQLELKRAVLADAFNRTNVPVLDLVGTEVRTGYRNKLEFSIKPNGGKLELAFHNRGSYEKLISLPEGCRLGSQEMNRAAIALADKAAELKLGGYAETLTVRRSESMGELLGHVALHQVPGRSWDALKIPEFAGVVVSRVRRRVEHELVWSSGPTALTESVGGLELDYPYDGFFQTNVPMFEIILQRILEAVPSGAKVVDLYGGVGTIGLAAARQAKEVLGVEINPSSVRHAEANAARAGLTNYLAVSTPAQRLEPKYLAGSDCIIVDPPRAGLEQRVVQEILLAAPQSIIYLSCNPVTQARDWQLLNDAYKTKGVTGFDMYPGTLHLESLMVLERK